MEEEETNIEGFRSSATGKLNNSASSVGDNEDVNMEESIQEMKTGKDPDRPALPWAFIDCEIDDLIILIAHMLNKLLEHNDQVVLTPSSLTRFHSRAPPGISVLDYLKRIVKYTNLEKLPLLSLLAYIDITCQNLPTFTLSSLTVHRFVISGITAGSKALCDVFCTNVHYAKVGGIKVGELNALEREFLRVTDWDLCVPAELIQQYYSSLIRSHGGYIQSEPPNVSPFTTFPLVATEKKKEDVTESAGVDDMEIEETPSLPVKEGKTGKDANEVSKVLDGVLADISSLPSTGRESVLSNVLDDLSDGTEGYQGFYTTWPEDILGKVLEAVKTLSRSPSGTTILTTAKSIGILMHQARIIPLPRPKGSTSDSTSSRIPEREALSTIANTLVLHQSETLKSLLVMGAGHAIVERIKADHDRSIASNGTETKETREMDNRLLFLYGRLVMWMTAAKESGFLEDLVEKDGLVGILIQELSKPYDEDRKMAIEEFLKVSFHALAVYPVRDETHWEATFGSLLKPLLELFDILPPSLTPPLSQVVNCLTRFPLSESLASTWEATESNLPKLVNIIHAHLDKVTPSLPWEFGDSIPKTLDAEKKMGLQKLEEVLTPAMLLLANVTGENKTMRRAVKQMILPAETDRSPGSTPLEKRWTLSGHLLRLMKASNYPHLSVSAGEVIWNICDRDAGILTREVGYGNVAGLLFSKGIASPTESPSSSDGPRIEELLDDDAEISPPIARNPMTGLQALEDSVPAGADMTQEEKEREAERLMHLFERMERNPAMKVMENPMKEMVRSGKMETWEKDAEEKERKRLEMEEEGEEEEALRELAQYKKRMKRN